MNSSLPCLLRYTFLAAQVSWKTAVINCGIYSSLQKGNTEDLTSETGPIVSVHTETHTLITQTQRERDVSAAWWWCIRDVGEVLFGGARDRLSSVRIRACAVLEVEEKHTPEMPALSLQLPSTHLSSHHCPWSGQPFCHSGSYNPKPVSLLAALLSEHDCGKNDSDLNREVQKQFVDLLTEELKLHEAVTEEHMHHMNITISEARRVASQYQMEAEKCNAATETCEGARERAEALLTKERKATSVWEKRARQLGWQGE